MIFKYKNIDINITVAGEIETVCPVLCGKYSLYILEDIAGTSPTV